MAGGSQRSPDFRTTKKVNTSRNISMLSEAEFDTLEGIYELNPFPPDVIGKEIARLFKIETAEVNDWFWKRRRQPKGLCCTELVVKLW